jgi:hypothetical protein
MALEAGRVEASAKGLILFHTVEQQAGTCQKDRTRGWPHFKTTALAITNPVPESENSVPQELT